LRILQISDTHISAEHTDFAQNGAAIGGLVSELKPDLVINTGDLAMNGCISPVYLELARSWHDTLGADFLAVPGNHDVGDLASIRADQVLDDARLAQFRSIARADRWIRDIPGWRLIGLNAMLFATGHADEEAQFAWFAEAVATESKIALFLHKPLFIDHPDEGARGYWTVLPAPRRRLLDLLAGRDLRLVASGHLHIARTLVLDGITHIWSPASSFVCGDSQEDLGGERRIGLVDYTFDADGFSHRFVFPAGAEDLQLDPILRRIYPSPRVAAE
jgi:3',5'-cyclic AMP phosphodiesterase CpdA